MTDPSLQQVERLLTPLLRSLETLGLIGRYLNPPELADVLASVGLPDADLRSACEEAEPWPEAFSALGAQLDAASDEALAAFDGLRLGATDPGALRELFRAMRHIPRALEALYPLTGILPPVNRFFLDAEHRKDEDFQKRFLGPRLPETGIIRFGEDPNARETVWAYVPETYSPDVAHPLVMALHGGSGRGRSFLWSWVRDARSRGAIVVAPTSLGETWAIQGEDRDTPHLAHILAFLRSRWNIDPARMMLSGMSDGGTFTYTSGLEASSPFTHLAPMAAAFHPMLVQMADESRLSGLPIHIIHGLKDWMFPADMARNAERYFSAAGANVTYREVADLSHTYPSDMNGETLEWLSAAVR
jgi:phospholipase/carboxylesterase